MFSVQLCNISYFVEISKEKAAKVLATCLLNDQKSQLLLPHFDLRSWTIDNIDTQNASGGKKRR